MCIREKFIHIPCKCLLLYCEWYLPGWGDCRATNAGLGHAGAIASSSDGPYTAVLEHTGTSIVIFKDEQWSKATAIVTLAQLAAGTFPDTFLHTLSWSPKGTFLVLCTTHGHLIVVTGAPMVSSVCVNTCTAPSTVVQANASGPVRCMNMYSHRISHEEVPHPLQGQENPPSTSLPLQKISPCSVASHPFQPLPFPRIASLC
jgi:hypothetical protein